jgi:hypothetical protein
MEDGVLLCAALAGFEGTLLAYCELGCCPTFALKAHLEKIV